MDDQNNQVFTAITTDASVAKVWDVLMDWDKLKAWSSSFIGICTSKLAVGKEFTSCFKNPLTGGVMELEYDCTDYEEVRKFGRSGDRIGKIQDHHLYPLEPTENGTTIFKQEDGLRGSHSRLLNFLGKHQMMSMYRKFNQEL